MRKIKSVIDWCFFGQTEKRKGLTVIINDLSTHYDGDAENDNQQYELSALAGSGIMGRGQRCDRRRAMP